jgi:hypothetical protein
MKTKKIVAVMAVLAVSGMLFLSSCKKEEPFVGSVQHATLANDTVDLPYPGWPIAGIDTAK